MYSDGAAPDGSVPKSPLLYAGPLTFFESIGISYLASITFKPSPLPEYLHTGMKKLL